MRILYIDLDSLRPDHLGCYGYTRPTSPNIDWVAARGVHFAHCYASDMPCMPSRTSLFSGRFGIHHGCVTHTGSRAQPFSEGPSRGFRSAWSRSAWMRLLQDAGWRTVTFSAFGERHSAWHWYAGFQEIYDTGHFGHDIADHVSPSVIGWLKENAEAPDWFVHVNLWDIHVPYRTPEAFGNRFADHPLAEQWLTQEMLDVHRTRPGIRSAQDALFLKYADKRPDLNPSSLENLDDVKLMVDGYDTGVSYADMHVGHILSTLDELGILEDTVIIVSADHGECLGELNAYGGHCFADEHTAHIPLIVRWPGITDTMAGACIQGLHYHIDLAATVNELLGIQIPDVWDAQSMADALRGDANVGRDYLVLSQLAQTCQRSVRFDHEEGAYLYIRTYRDGYYCVPNELLFDLPEDPHELYDLSSQRPDLVTLARRHLHAWEEDCLAQSNHDDPLHDVLAEFPEVKPEKYERVLKNTGREDWIKRIHQHAFNVER